MKISFIVPVYNEQDTIPFFYQTIRENHFLQQFLVEIIFINDGSHDNTGNILAKITNQDTLVISIDFFRNFGKEAALLAGLHHATGDAIIPIDVDLQDPIEVAVQLIEKWQATHADCVLAKRVDRSSDTFVKRKSAELFYRFHNFTSDIKIEENVGDFRLISKELKDNILKLPEKNLFMKGILSWCGGHIEIVKYTRSPRFAGNTKFNALKLWKLALDGITSFSTFALKIWTYIGFIVAILSFLYASIMVIQKIVWGNDVPGYASIITCILFLGGLQLMGIGILGEYLGRVYLETKQRPRYIIRSAKNYCADKSIKDQV